MNTKIITRPISIIKITSRINNYVLVVIVIGIVALLCAPLSNSQGYHLVSYLMLFIVSFLATFMGIGPVFLASSLAALVWNYFFIPPHFTFHIDKAEDILMFGMFFIIAVLNGVLTTRIRKQEKIVIDREERTNALFQLTKQLSKASGLEQVLEVSAAEIEKNFGIAPEIILQDGKNGLNITEQMAEKFSAVDLSIAQEVFTDHRIAGKFAGKYSDSNFTYYPLVGTKISPGVVAIKSDKPFKGDQIAFHDAFFTQVSNALEREFLGELARKARFLDESDRLYKTLFNSISHELRIPVSTVLGAAETLMTSSHPESVRAVLYNEILTASIRLNRLIENLLNISRLESGRISIRLDWHDLNDLVNKVIDELKTELKPFTLKISVPQKMPLVKMDFGLMEQVLYNLLVNACEYAPASSAIDIKTNLENEVLEMQIMDQGPGFTQEEIQKVFDKFYKVKGNRSGGLGLGLSIVKGFVEAHKGTISLENRKSGGACFTIKIPSGSPEVENIPDGKI